MAHVCDRLSAENNIGFVAGLFLKVARQHYSGEVSEFTISGVKFAQDSVHQKYWNRFIVAELFKI